MEKDYQSGLDNPALAPRDRRRHNDAAGWRATVDPAASPPEHRSEGGIWAKTSRLACSVFPVKPDQLALNLHPVGRQDPHLIGGVGGFQRDRCAAATEAF